MNTQILYFTLSAVCLWCVLSQFFDDKYITKFLTAIMPNAVNDGWFS